MSTAVAEQRTEQRAVSIASRLEMPPDMKEAGAISVSENGLVLTSMSQAIEFAKLMARMGEAIPKHLRDKPGACLAVCIQAFEWRISPLALANKSYVVNDRLCYEAALYQSVVARRAPIRGRIKMEYFGEGASRVCRVWADLADGTGAVEYESPKFSTINPKNSPLWKNDPDQQLFYFSVRGFARRHFNDVMMGIYTVDEMVDAIDAPRTVESRPKSERLAERLLGAESQESDTASAAGTQTETFFSGDTDDRRKRDAEVEQPVVVTAAELANRLEKPRDQMAISKVEADAAAAVKAGHITQAECDEISIMCNDARQRV